MSFSDFFGFNLNLGKIAENLNQYNKNLEEDSLRGYIHDLRERGKLPKLESSFNTVPVPKEKPLELDKRKKAILEDNSIGFSIASNMEVDDEAPWYELDNFSQVNKYKDVIDRKSKEMKMDSDLIKSIVHMETTHGYYDAPLSLVGMNKSIKPMNINAEYWKDLGYTRDDLNDPEKNIMAGMALLNRIQKQIPDGDIAKVATIYNNLNATKVSDYGARVAKIYKKKPWKND